MKILYYLLFLAALPCTFLMSQTHTVQYLNCPNCTERNHTRTGLVFTYDSTATDYESAHVASDFDPRDLSSINQAAYDRSEEVSYY